LRLCLRKEAGRKLVGLAAHIVGDGKTARVVKFALDQGHSVFVISCRLLNTGTAITATPLM
jgi:hypothetical protein